MQARMEEGMQMLRIIPADFVKATEKAREKERREKAREDNMATLAAAMEERRIRSLERSKVCSYHFFVCDGDTSVCLPSLRISACLQ